MIPISKVENMVLLARGQKVMLDNDLAELYGVSTKALVQALKRNQARFPRDFVFRLTPTEFENLRSQSVTSKGRGGRRYPPYAFNEHGAIMMAAMLNSERAIDASILVVRAFVRLRELVAVNAAIANKLTELERKIAGHDESIVKLFAAIRQLMTPPELKKRKIGFAHDE